MEEENAQDPKSPAPLTLSKLMSTNIFISSHSVTQSRTLALRLVGSCVRGSRVLRPPWLSGGHGVTFSSSGNI